jgi:hypothetical protein
MIIPKTVKIEYTNELLTPAAGLVPLIHFLKKIHFSETINRYVEHRRGATATYSFTDAIESIVVGAIRGVKSMLQIAKAWEDPVLAKLSGTEEQHPHNSTLGRIMAEAGQKDDVGMREAIIALGKSIRKDAGAKILPVDGDSTVKTVYGAQEGVAVGYNPHKLGAASYHPLLLFHSETKEILLGKLRPGDAYTSNGGLATLQELAAQFPNQRIRGRFDSGFFDGKLMDWMDANQNQYLIKAKLKGLKALLQSLEWVPVTGQPDCECSLHWYRAGEWEYQRLLQIVRIKKHSRTEALSSETEDEVYAYFCYACNYELDPWQVHKEYGKRATSENWIQEAKNQLGICSIKTKAFWANAVIFQAMVMAYNVIRWMALKSQDPLLISWEINTVRQNLIGMAGKLIRRARQWILRVPKSMLYPLQWERWIKAAFS